ncbi:hypothetical protein Bbelb_420840 [Branchiostoma belcheri]|nr:hypothetical protein Bbelb_439960 [Branchiostoma belcheri]KAI8480165.1 hypothetical protein Bbelb_420840 [Branchiostoma belcheri]
MTNERFLEVCLSGHLSRSHGNVLKHDANKGRLSAGARHPPSEQVVVCVVQTSDSAGRDEMSAYLRCIHFSKHYTRLSGSTNKPGHARSKQPVIYPVVML